MKLWEVQILVQVVTREDETAEDARAKVQPYADAMGVTGVHVGPAVELQSESSIKGDKHGN